MPIEVTPPPFADQQLPYTPKFVRQDIEGLPGSGQSVLSRGPASVQAAAIIPPQPGAVSSPHRAIPALPETGYTSTTLHPASLSNRDALSAYGGRSVYGELPPPGPGSYLPHAQLMPPGGMAGSTIHQDGWMATSLPSPRRGPPLSIPNLAPMAPPAESGVSRQGTHHHHHHQHHHSPSRSTQEDDWERQSDASYYARPKPRRHNSGYSSSVSSGQSDGTSPREASHHRSRSINNHHHHHHSHQPSPPPASHHNSPGAPSPLSLAHAAPSRARQDKSPLSPGKLRHDKARLGYEDDERGRKHTSLPPEPRDTHEHRYTHSPQVYEAGQIAPSETAASHRHHHHDGTRRGPKSVDEEYLSERHGHRDRHDTYGRVKVDGDYHRPRHRSPSLSDRHQHEHHHHDHHHPHHDPGSRIPPPQGAVHASPPSIAPSSLGGDYGTRCRAVSMQFGDEREHLTGGIGPGLLGGSLFQPPSIAGLQIADQYDDGASVAGSGLTFLDGAVGGRTSQYGLPRYPREIKPDYRRFCVQRGNADVYLD